MALGPTAAQRALEQTIQRYNGKPEILTAIVKQRTSIKGRLGNLFITSVDSRGTHVNLLYHPDPDDTAKKLEVQFEPALKSPWEFKSTLEAWEAEVKKRYEIPERPLIRYYSPPPLFPLTVPILVAIGALLFADFGRGYYADVFRAWIVRYFGPYMIRGAECFAAFMHLFSEPIWMFVLLRRHQTPWSVGWKWMLTVFLLGAPGIREFDECVEYEKISHLYSRTDVGSSPHYLERKSAMKEKKE